MDVPEVGLGAMAGRVRQRDERLAAVEALLLQVAPDLVVAAGVVVLGDEPSEDLGGGVALLGRRGPVGDEDVIDDGAERPEGRCRARLGEGVRDRLGVGDRFTHGVPSDAQSEGDGADAVLVGVQPSDLGEVVHRSHPSPLRPASTPIAEAVLRWS